MATVLITGANRGIGLEFARQLSARGDAVIATARDLGGLSAGARGLAGVRWASLDVADAASIDGLSAQLDALPGGVGTIDVLINNAGVSSTAKTLTGLSAAELHRVFAVNTFAPMLVTKSLMPRLAAGGRKLIVNITSQLGSIANNTGGSTYPYRASKAGLNQLNASLANELRPGGFTCLVMHPGWVQTDMGGKQATLTPEASVRSLLSVIDRAEPGMSGRFLNYDGTPLPW
jgi:NAD(P)-dependent dehydrogenase (short-subunit alcohol dehydrogenase family)